MSLKAAIFHRSVKLEESQLEPPDPRCQFCGSIDRYNVHILQETPLVTLQKCNNCYAISASRLPTEQMLIEYYSNYYNDSISDFSNGNITFDNPKRLTKYLADNFTLYNSKSSISILDFGGGDGTISHLLALQLLDRGLHNVWITVVDFCKNPISVVDRRIEIEMVDSLGNINRQYEFVLASAVIEHNPTPGALISELLKRLNQGGIFYSRTPCIFPIIRLFKTINVSIDFTYPGHLHDLGQKFWGNLFIDNQSQKFQVLVSKPSIVETTFNKHFVRTLIAYICKAPWYILGKYYKYVGGWEILVKRRN